MSSYEISKSSLLSLKAEILRKQDELAKAKRENAEKIKSIKKTPLDIKNKGVEERQLADLDSEEQDLLKLSRSKLEAKSKLYDKLSGNPQKNETSRLYLVRFDKKDRVADQYNEDESDIADLPVISEEEEKDLSDYYDEDVDPANEWVEYTDCLGRTRKCLRKDLDHIKSRDADLKLLADKRRQSRDELEVEATNTSDKNEEENETAEVGEREMISGDMRRDMLRRQWEREEEELRDKTDIHYQNVLFDEARQHGVGYYAFSKDEDERAKQQEALKQLRKETQQEQNKAHNLKALRDQQMAARMKAARNRRRARLGLPPEEDEPAQEPEPNEDTEEEKKKQEEKKKLEEAEKVLTEARKRHLRPWDVGKEGTSKFYEMSQHEWNEKKRKERPAEFAPPAAYNAREFSGMRSLESDVDDSDKSLRFSTKVQKPKLKNLNRYKDSNRVSNILDNNDEDGEDDHLNHHKKSKMEPVPINNEVDDADFDDALLADYHKTMEKVILDTESCSTRKRAEIPPPTTFEYFGPTEVKKPKNPREQINLGDSIEAGLKFLRHQTEGKKQRDKF